MKKIALLFTFAMCSAVFAQPDTLWSRTFGGPYSDYCYSVRQTQDQGFILAGYTTHEAFGPEDFYLVKTNAIGEFQWERSYGGPSLDVCWQIREVPTGGFILAGSSQSYGGVQDGLIIKTSDSGDSLWSRTYGGAGWDEIYSVDPTDDGGFILGGYTGSYGEGAFDFWMIKTGDDGDQHWMKTFGQATVGEFATAVLQSSDGGYLISGFMGDFSPTNTYFWVIKTDANGDSLWSAQPALGECFSMRETSDGGVILIGIDQEGDDGDARVIKLNASGATEWIRDIGGDAEDLGSVVEETIDGGFVCAGYTRSFGAGTRDLWVFKLSATGDSLWSTNIGGADFESSSSIQQLADGSFINAGGQQLTGPGSYDFYVVKFEPEIVLPPLTANPPELDFGGCLTRTTNDLPVTIRNNTTLSIQLVGTHVNLEEAFSVIDFPGGRLQPGDSTTFTVRFYPTESLEYIDTLIVETPLSSFLMQIPLHGVGLEFHLTLEPASLDFGEIHVGERDTLTAAIINDGEWTTHIDGGYFSPEAGVFRYENLNTILPPDSQLTFSVIFSPLFETLFTANLIIENHVSQLTALPLSGSGIITSGEEISSTVPDKYYLFPAYPNPFNPSTTIEFGLPQESFVTLSVFDITGRLVTELVNKQLPAGIHHIEFNGQTLPSGIYLYTMNAGSFSHSRKVILLK